MSETLGQTIVIDNRGGAGGTVGTRAAAKSAPDGYTILLSYTGTMAIGPHVQAAAGYDPRKDFAPIGRIGATPMVIVVHPSVPGEVGRRADRADQEGAEARINTARPASAPSAISPASCSPIRPSSRWRTSPTRAPGR